MKRQSKPAIRAAALAALSLALTAIPARAVTRTWDGGGGNLLWSTAANWDADTLPSAGNDVAINTPVTVDWTGGGMSTWNVTLTNGANLRADVNYARLNGATINVGPTSTLSNTAGKGWDLNGGNLSFQNGAAAPVADWELKGTNVFSFKLGAAGFTKLTPGTLRWQTADKFTNSTWNVDMADYTGPSPASIILVDFTSAADPANMTAANFLAQATRNVTNAGANVGSTIVYEPIQAAFILKVQVAPYVAPLAPTVWDGGGGTNAWTTATNWDPDFVPAANAAVAIDGAVTVDMVGLADGLLPSGAKVALTNGSTLTISSGVCRMNGTSSVSVGNNCTLNKYWAMGSGSMSFQEGAKWTAGDVELSGPNVFSFKLGPAGFTKLTPGTLRWNSTTKFSQQTWNVDMAAYTGPSPASIILMDCSSAADAAMTSALWLAQATRNVTNAGANVGSTIVYDPVQAAFVLKVQVAAYVPPVADLVWDGGGGSALWTTATNWDPDFVPATGNTVAIASAVTVDCPSVFLPASTVSLTNGAGMTCSAGAVRLQAATKINVASGSTLSGAFWDMNGGTINFQNGAVATMAYWELKGTTRFTFKLGAAGFTKLTPGTLYGTTITTSTWVADMADYTGGPGIIPLVDYTTDSYTGGMSSATFLTSTLSVINPGIYTANLQWNNTTKAVELNVTGGGSPYTTWATTFLPGNDVSDPAGDNDHDGLTNQQEFAFGLSPISGSSVNPILVQLNPTTGTFTYQRRAAAGLTYTVLISTSLAAGSWTVDAASQIAGAVDVNGNETVVVTLTGTKPLAATELFVRVAAN